MEQAHKTLTLKQLLLRANDAEQDRLNRSFYLMTNHVGEGENFVGADATASWWHRNFRMFAVIQRYAQPGERVLVIGGQGHVAILKLFLDDDERRAVDVTSYL
jgi:regulator of RNase E activity RraA